MSTPQAPSGGGADASDGRPALVDLLERALAPIVFAPRPGAMGRLRAPPSASDEPWLNIAVKAALVRHDRRARGPGDPHAAEAFNLLAALSAVDETNDTTALQARYRRALVSLVIAACPHADEAGLLALAASNGGGYVLTGAVILRARAGGIAERPEP